MSLDDKDPIYKGSGPHGSSANAATGHSPIIEVVRKLLTETRQEVTITENYTFNLFETLNKIELYRASKFKSGDRDSQGDKKFFMNIVNAPAGSVTKNIDLDSSDFTILADDGSHAVNAFLYREKLRDWLATQRIGMLLNRISENLPIYGQVVLKRISKTELEFVPLKDLYRDPGILGIQNSGYLVQHYRMLPEQVKGKKAWNQEKVKEVLEKFFSSDDRHINIYEHYGWMRKSVFDEVKENVPIEKDEYVKVRTISAMDIHSRERDKKEQNSFDTVLFKELWDKPWPYKELNLFEIEGRSLGLGIFELLFDLQQRWNEMANQKAKSMQLSSKHVYQTQGNSVEKNVLTELDDGQILKVDKEITPIGTEERNLSAYRLEEQNVMKLASDLASNQDVVSGSALPSGTPYRLGALLEQNASKLHEYVREKFGLFFEDVLNDWLIPEFDAEMDKEFIMSLEDPDLTQMIVEADITQRLNRVAVDYLFDTGDFPTAAQQQMLKEQMKMEYKGKQFVKILKGFLKFGKRIRVVSTGENVNIKQQVESLSNAVQLLAQNPQALQMPETRRLLQTLFAKVGIPPADLYSPAPAQAPAPGAEAGVPAPNQLGGGGQPGIDAAMMAGRQGVPVAQQP